ncbi:Endonuclease/exonuclease/phosphatase [Gamsiella multidivaricata]|uniref:Endonuclease/exonuclease/phosphatase n=1 Tax=Gamsiella multidivaricata TaxID=101098 RepID=UPI00221F927E|nr:Endonuclease/exonuclease/phosphatase [Gamsiella multidivaricata]KAI7815879.1 Endonuclease/exonuclease/phosphatase [Gamsiella multidivaricata]
MGIWEHTSANHHGKGVGLLITHDWFKFLISSSHDENGRGVMALFGFKRGLQLAVINCYVPTLSSDTRVEHNRIILWVKNQVESLRTKGVRVILLGDFNGVVNPSIDRSSTDHTSTVPELSLFTWLTTRNFTDSFRLLHPTTPLFCNSSRVKGSRAVVNRLDMVWVSNDLAGFLLEVKSSHLVAPIRSDHALVAATFDVHTLVSPTPHHIQSAHCVKSKKILVDAASEEQWSDFSSQVEEFLPLYGQLESYGLAEYLQGDPETTYASPELLQTLHYRK